MAERNLDIYETKLLDPNTGMTMYRHVQIACTWFVQRDEND